ncbi:MAG: hypothetical protein K8H87_12280 [Pseudorhodoplanes sp.]|nr:hypothetical protein [Pseudorhodoplanes sp.]
MNFARSAFDTPRNSALSTDTIIGTSSSTISRPALVSRTVTSRLLVFERVRVTSPRRTPAEIRRETVGASRLVAADRSTCRNSPRCASTASTRHIGIVSWESASPPSVARATIATPTRLIRKGSRWLRS